MRRVTSMVFIGGWAGFFSTASVAASLAIVSAGYPSTADLPVIGGEIGRIADVLVAKGNSAVLVAAMTGFSFASVALLLGLSMWMLQGSDRSDRSAGERLAVATLGFAALVVGSLGLAGMDIMTDQVSVGGVLLVLGLSAAALMFDRLVEVDEVAEAAEEGFYRNALLLSRQFGRDAALRPSADESAPEARR